MARTKVLSEPRTIIPGCVGLSGHPIPMSRIFPTVLALLLACPWQNAWAETGTPDIAGRFQDALDLFNERLDENTPLKGRAVQFLQPSAGEFSPEDRRRKEDEIRRILYSRQWDEGQARILLHLENLGVSPLDLWYGCHFVLHDGGNYYRDWEETGSKSRISSHYRDSEWAHALPNQQEIAFLSHGLLFGTSELGGDTWFQVERHGATMGGAANVVGHVGDFLAYSANKKNVGPMGQCERTDKNPIVIEVPDQYLFPLSSGGYFKPD